MVGVPSSPHSESSLESLREGLLYIRQNPTEREDERVQRFLWLDQWIRLLSDKGRMTKNLADEFVQDLSNFVQNPPMSGRSLDQIVSRAESSLGRNVAYYQLYLTGLRTTTVQQAMSALEFVEDDGFTDFYSRAQDLLQLQFAGEVVASRKIGVLIPLSGELSAFGEEVLSAIQLVSDLDYTKGVEFVVHDIGDSDAQLLEAFQRLVLDEGVSAIIGPITNRASEFIFERAQIMRVPVISLAPREDLEFFGDFNFRSSLTIQDQVRSIASFLRRQLRASRVGILYPDSSFGWDAAKRAQQEFKEAGLEVTEVALYSEGATDFKDPLQKMTRLANPQARAAELCQENDVRTNCVQSLDNLPPILNFEVLFVPDFADSLGLLMPTLPFLRIYGVQVIGLSSAHASPLIERAQQHAEGVIVTDSFVMESDELKNRIFLKAFRDKTGRDPSRLGAEAFDVALMLADRMLNPQQPVSREGLRQEISQIRGFDGVTGAQFTVGNELRRQPQFLVVRDGKFKQIK
jgi:ABC-type branched-subunit amino acid transport system substrate-binding protein